jgi:hypothetical protein
MQKKKEEFLDRKKGGEGCAGEKGKTRFISCCPPRLLYWSKLKVEHGAKQRIQYTTTIGAVRTIRTFSIHILRFPFPLLLIVVVFIIITIVIVYVRRCNTLTACSSMFVA